MPVELDPRTWLSFEGRGPAENDWLRLYLVALAVLIPTAIFQLFTVYLLTLLFTLIANGHGNFGLANMLPWIVVGGYFGWATSALYPLGAGRTFAEAIRARPATSEEAEAYQERLDGLSRRTSLFRADGPTPDALEGLVYDEQRARHRRFVRAHLTNAFLANVTPDA